MGNLPWVAEPSREHFTRAAAEGLWTSVAAALAQAPSPVEAASALREAGPLALLESARYDHKIGRYSVVARGAPSVIRLDGTSTVGEAMGSLRRALARRPLSRLPGIPPFQGGLVGFLGYEAGRWFERLPSRPRQDMDTPDVAFMVVDEAVAYDHMRNAVFLVAAPDVKLPPGEAYDEACSRIGGLWAELTTRHGGGTRGAGRARTYRAGSPAPNMSRAAFENMVRSAKEHIFAGDIYQVNLSLRLDASWEGDPLSLYEQLRRVNPSPFGGFLDFGDFQLVSSSPERLLKLAGDIIETRPIAGTRPRGVDAVTDELMTAELLLNEKEQAEHIMLVDLERNDLGRVSTVGTVRVDELMVTEDYSHVIHIVSNVCGDLRPGLDALDVIAACFPGGTITGCPKIRSMEIIGELEPVARGPYTGSMGYISYTGDMDLNIIIRTFLIKGGFAHVQAGAGIVADSDPAREYYESLQKAQALVEALDQGQHSLSGRTRAPQPGRAQR